MLEPNARFKDPLSGHFTSSLYDAYCRADSGNRERIEKAFPHYFKIDPVETFGNALHDLVNEALDAGVVLDIVWEPLLPLAMSNVEPRTIARPRFVREEQA